METNKKNIIIFYSECLSSRLLYSEFISKYPDLIKCIILLPPIPKSSNKNIKQDKSPSLIKRLIGKALNELKNNNYENATKLYSEITDMLNNFPEFFLEEKKALNREIFHIHEKLKDNIDSKFIEDTRRSIIKVDVLIREAFSKFKVGNIEDSKKIYENTHC